MAPIERQLRVLCARPVLARLALAACAAFACMPGVARAGRHAADAAITAVDGRPGWFEVRNGRQRTVARWPSAPRENLVPSFVIRAMDHGWDADGSPETLTDTLVVPAGSTVRWLLVSGIHTLTDGRSAADPEAGKGFDYLLDEQHTQFDSTFSDPDTVDYFCFFHEPAMRGVIVVIASAGVPPEPLPSRLAFTHPPRPNPSRGTVSFDVGLAREQTVRVEVLDLLGTRVALLHDGPLAPGEHPFRWRGVTEKGDRAQAGVYIVRLSAGALETSRQVSLLR
jgi:flagellar hook capping protein FlgD